MKKKLFIGLFTLLFGLFVHAQNVVNVTSVLNFPTSVSLGDQYSFSVGLTYVSGENLTFSPEYLRLNYLTDKMIELDNEPEFLGPPHDELIFSQNIPLAVEVNDFDFDSSNFRQGGNIVVIWPSYVGGNTNDSLSITVEGTLAETTNSAMSIQDIDLKTVWINEEINWKSLEKIGITDGLILDEQGKILYVLNKQKAITKNDIEAGLHYFVFGNGKGKFLVFKEFNH